MTPSGDDPLMGRVRVPAPRPGPDHIQDRNEGHSEDRDDEQDQSLNHGQGFAAEPSDPTVTTPTAPTADPAPDPDTAALHVPHPSPGLELLGEYRGSGFTERKYMVRRADGQMLMLSRLLYLVVGSVDGVRTAEAVSHRVSGRYGAEVTAQNVMYLVERRLTPLGVTLPAPGQEQETKLPRSDLMLALRGHRVIFREEQVARIASALAWLHWPPMVALMLAGVAAVDVWLFAVHGAITPLLRVLEQPVWMITLFVLTVASLLFHEFGHASACRYSGAAPGKIGCGIFLIWPSMYTDVTDVYRAGRAGRLRTGLGGVYFNAVFMLVLAAGYALTGQPVFLAALYLTHFEVLEQLMPIVRLDGYYILGDLAGVPDLFGRIKPVLLDMVPGRRRRTAAGAHDLNRPARITVTAWVLAVIPVLAAETAYVLWNLPRLLTTAVRSLAHQCDGTYAAFADGRPGAGVVGVIGTLMLLCPLAGGIYLACRIGVRLARAALRSTRDRPTKRLVLAAAVGVGILGLTFAWWQGLTPRPLPAAAPVTPVLQPAPPTTRPPQPTPEPSSSPSPSVSRPTATPSAVRPLPRRTSVAPSRPARRAVPPVTATATPDEPPRSASARPTTAPPEQPSPSSSDEPDPSESESASAPPLPTTVPPTSAPASPTEPTDGHRPHHRSQS
ncbi:M50 family metallopeptidase [Streptomyces sp. SID4985]|uniref:M50 family metallopeptidase n=1 Tax=Streptomyces sp. SID4985 TaxID=2690292 RepID=UPI0019280C96|nr:M50 family metallopeptidase [Streptomyces sp. SID4985]